MSNYPDNFNGTNMDAEPDGEFPAEMKALDNVQMAYKECVEAIIRIMKRRGLTHYPRRGIAYKSDIDWITFTGVEDILEASIRDELKTLADAGYDCSARGDDHVTFFDRMYALLKEGEVKPPMIAMEMEMATRNSQARDVEARLREANMAEAKEQGLLP